LSAGFGKQGATGNKKWGGQGQSCDWARDSKEAPHKNESFESKGGRKKERGKRRRRHKRCNNITKFWVGLNEKKGKARKKEEREKRNEPLEGGQRVP